MREIIIPSPSDLCKAEAVHAVREDPQLGKGKQVQWAWPSVLTGRQEESGT